MPYIIEETILRDKAEEIIAFCREHPEFTVRELILIREQAVREIENGLQDRTYRKPGNNTGRNGVELPDGQALQAAGRMQQAGPAPMLRVTDTDHVPQERQTAPIRLTQTAPAAEKKAVPDDYEILRKIEDPWN